MSSWLAVLLLAGPVWSGQTQARRQPPRRVEAAPLPQLPRPAHGLTGSPARAEAVVLAQPEIGSVSRFARALEGSPRGAPALEPPLEPATRFARAERSLEAARAAAAAAFRPRFAALPIADAYDPRHWRPELVADARYGRLLGQAAERLARGDSADTPDRSRALQARRETLERMRERAPAIHSHMMRVGLLSGMLAWELGYPEDFAQNAAWGGRVHDLGKLDERVLEVVSLRRPLDEGERRVMQSHTVIGAKLVLANPSLDVESRRVGARTALSHHETWDATGYPYGAPAGALPMVSRLVSTADMFDALMENRPYRPGMSIERALAVMERERVRFDPEVWRALRRLVERR